MALFCKVINEYILNEKCKMIIIWRGRAWKAFRVGKQQEKFKVLFSNIGGILRSYFSSESSSNSKTMT